MKSRLFLVVLLGLFSCSKDARYANRLAGEWESTFYKGYELGEDKQLSWKFQEGKKEKGQGEQTQIENNATFLNAFSYEVNDEKLILQTNYQFETIIDTFDILVLTRKKLEVEHRVFGVSRFEKK